jgi:nitrite reductase/ring-hydroxylating ferredoxin subunit
MEVAMKVPLCKVEEIPQTGTKSVDFFGREVLVYQASGHPRAILNVCMHFGGPLKLEDDRLVCAWHAAEFQAQDGRCVHGPAAPDSRLITLPTRIENGVLTYVYGE